MLSDVSTRSTLKLGEISTESKLGSISTVSIPTKIGACSGSVVSRGFQSIPTVSSIGGIVSVVVWGTRVVVVKNTFAVVAGGEVVVVDVVVVVEVVEVVVEVVVDVDVVSGVRFSGSTAFIWSAIFTKEGNGSRVF